METSIEQRMSHQDIMSARDGAVYVVTLPGTSKIVRDGVTLARAISYVDGTFAVFDRTMPKPEPVSSWEHAAKWLESRVLAFALTAGEVFLVTFGAKS